MSTHTFPIFVNALPCDGLIVQYASVTMPLPRGKFFASPSVQIKNVNGEAVPSQSDVLAKWPDGSTRVVHLTFPAHGGEYSATAVSNQSTPIDADNAIKLQHNAEEVSIVTGRLRVVLGGDAILQSVHLGERLMLDAGGIEVLVTDEQGSVFRASAAREVETIVELHGPLRLVEIVHSTKTRCLIFACALNY